MWGADAQIRASIEKPARFCYSPVTGGGIPRLKRETRRRSGTRGPEEVTVAENEFYDIHCHAHTFSHPSFLAILEAVRGRKMEAVYSQITSFDYLGTALFRHGSEKVRNLISVMENEPGDIFRLMEDDLEGLYCKEGEKALVRNGKMAIGGTAYDRLVICPLLIDFDFHGPGKPDTYYDRYPSKPIEAQIFDVLAGVAHYRRLRPEGFLEIHPFLGVNPKAHTPESMEAFLSRWFSGFAAGRKASREIFLRMGERFPDPGNLDFSPFAGVKAYPPLGFNPWPDDPAERETVETLFSFCEKRRIPVTTHCDDGGFRVVPLEESWRQTSPMRYLPILERHPDLVINFAHMGMQYSIQLRRPPSEEWKNQVLSLMAEFPNVYTDFSFNGTEEAYYVSLAGLLSEMSDEERERVGSRIMFGSDFPVNLFKIRSYADYYRLFDDSILSEGLKRKFASENPERFLFGE